MIRRLFLLMILSLPLLSRAEADWVRGGTNGQQTLWGIRGKLLFAIPPAIQGPRGLIRLLYPTKPGGEYDLINFIAVEPIVEGRRGLSELERSKLDQVEGKRFWVDETQRLGILTRSEGKEMLEVPLQVEEFDNGARVRVTITQSSLNPDELTLTVRALPQSKPIKFCILTATMGNKARTRVLWLKGESVKSGTLYAGFEGRGKFTGFARHQIFPLNRLTVTKAGDVLAAVTTDEPEPAKVYPFPGTPHWYYGGFPVTQYWKKPPGTYEERLEVAVNARYTYWGSDQPIPGGVAFENFEMREPFREGQVFVFGITSQTPAELGLAP